MVFAFAGLSTITSFFAMARDTLAAHIGILLRVAPRPSPVYILVAAAQLAAPLRPLPAACAGQEHLPRGRLRARGEPQLELRSLAARRCRSSRAAICASWRKSELFWTPFSSSRQPPGRFPVRRGERDTAAIETAARLCREGHVVVMFPEGTRRKKGLRKKLPGRGRTPAPRGSRSTPACRSSRPRSSAPTGSAGSRSSGSRTARRCALDDLAGRDDAPRRSRPSG